MIAKDLLFGIDIGFLLLLFDLRETIVSKQERSTGV